MFINRSKCLATFLVFACVLIAGCPTPTPTPRDCVPGETQVCSCAGGGTGVQTCNSSGSGWGACAGCSGGPPPSDGGTTCRPPGVPVLVCGCWGPAVEGQIVSAGGCCSGFATQTRCTGFCAGGGSSWGNICN